ncbi:MAG: YciI family protein [Pseudomonadota bacterium]
MFFLVRFHDAPAAPPDLRQRHMAAHLAFLQSHADRIEAAGPVALPDGTAAGGAWLVRASSADEVEDLIQADPFWTTGLRDRHEVLAWTRVFPPQEPA